MLIFLVYLFTFIGAFFLITAAVIKLKLVYPLTDHNKLIVEVSALKMKFSERYVISNNTCIIALNHNTKKVAIGTLSNTEKTASSTLYSYHDILGCEMIENALTLRKVTKNSRIHRRDIETREVTTTELPEEINELTVNIYIAATDLKSQCLRISFLTNQQNLIKSDTRYTQIFAEALHLYQLLTTIVTHGESIDCSEPIPLLKRSI